MELKKRKQLIIKAVCVIAAFGLWIYASNMDNNIISHTIKNVKVELINTDALAQIKLAEVPTGDYTVNLTVKVMASDVKTIKASDFKVVADMAAYSLKKGENSIPFDVTVKPSNVTVVIVNDMRIKVKLDDLLERTVPVKIDIKGKPKQGFQQLNPTVKPTDVLIRGAAEYVNKVTKVVATYDIAGQDKDANVSIALVPKDATDSTIDNVKVLETYGKLIIPIKKVKTVGVVVKTKGELAGGAVYKAVVPIPDKVDIAGNDEDLKAITSIETEVVDLTKISADSYSTGTLEAKLIIPKNVKLVGVNGSGVINFKIDSTKTLEKTLNLDIQYKNSDLFIVKPDKSQLTLVVSGDEAVINKLINTDITCYVDLANASEGDISLPVVLSNLPAGVTKVSGTPDTLKLNIAKKPKA